MLTWKYVLYRVIGYSNVMDKVKVNDERFYERLIQGGTLGLGESYMEGDWDCDHLDELFYQVKKERLDKKEFFSPFVYLQNFIKFIFSFVWNNQSKEKSIEVAIKHYNLSNEMFEHMLDERMIYSCGYWKNAKTLDDAQVDKLDLICQKVKLEKKSAEGKEEKKVIDIGCGWGGFVQYAHENYHVDVEGITISKEQLEYAVEHSPEALKDNFKFMDYRNLLTPENKRRYDAVVSIGMFEHVGPKNYLHFLKVCEHLVKPDGFILVHTIGGLTSKKVGDPWIDKYIFPNSVLPTLSQFTSEVEKTQLVIEDVHNFGADYDLTLMSWYTRFKSWFTTKPKEEQENEQCFYRMWTYYLLQCAGLFRARDLQLYQFVLTKNGVEGGYSSVR